MGDTKYLLSLSEDMHKKLKLRSVKEDTTVRDLILNAVNKDMDEQPIEPIEAAN